MPLGTDARTYGGDIIGPVVFNLGPNRHFEVVVKKIQKPGNRVKIGILTSCLFFRIFLLSKKSKNPGNMVKIIGRWRLLFEGGGGVIRFLGYRGALIRGGVGVIETLQYCKT